MRRVMLVGLDCLSPQFAFERYRASMPWLSRLMERGAWGRLRSTMPPITVPAWTSMVSGRDPGELGLYGFRKRRAGAYGLSLVDSSDVRCDRVWDVLARHGKRSTVLFVPPSFPPRAIPGGQVVSCFLTPGTEQPYTYPASLRGELELRFGAYRPDVEVRRADRQGLFEQLCEMTRQHFDIACHLWETREPDFMMLVEIGADRLHHAFWADMDESHPRHDAQSPFVDVGERYYRLLDQQLGRLMTLADEDTLVLVASDHGARPLRGCFLINEWLMQNGWLRLKAGSSPRGPLRPEWVDWSATRAWAEGGYYARVFLNVRGREPSGVVEAHQVAELTDELRRSLMAVTGEGARRWNNQVETPASLYASVHGDAPDLLAVFDDLSVRALSLVGDGQLFAERDDRGPDACNHDFQGMVALAGGGTPARGQLFERSIYDVGATVLAAFGLERPRGFRGEDLRGGV